MRIDLDFAILRNIFSLLRFCEEIPRLIEDVKSLRKEVSLIMATVTEILAQATQQGLDLAALKQAVADEKAQVKDGFDNATAANEDLKKQIVALQDIINAGGAVPQALVDQMAVNSKEITDQLAAVSDIFTPAP